MQQLQKKLQLSGIAQFLLKTIIRSNPGLVLMREGTLLQKWHFHDMPSEAYWNLHLPDYLSEKDIKREEEGLRISNLFTFTLPLLLVWVYDFIRNRRGQKKKQEKK